MRQTNLRSCTSLGHRTLSIQSCVQRKCYKQRRWRVGGQLGKVLKQNKTQKIKTSVISFFRKALHQKIYTRICFFNKSCTSLIIVFRVFSNHLISTDRHIRSFTTLVTSCCHRDTMYSSSARISSEQFFKPYRRRGK